MATRITAAELNRKLSEILSRVRYRGETFLVDHNGETVATIEPVRPVPSGSWRAFAERVRHLPRDPSFADDLETIQQGQSPAQHIRARTS
ncbi:MAG: hypothetical protein HY332_07200 [Chloroflexi bacterium]|nr:hypothetical protein [Chloroflexota bacterium]